MSDHLPECLRIEYTVNRHGYTLTAGSNGCICDRLRACEARVLQEIDREAFALDEGDPYREAYRAGLDAAREAVERVSTLFEPLGPALAAIDALREEQK